MEEQKTKLKTEIGKLTKIGGEFKILNIRKRAKDIDQSTCSQAIFFEDGKPSFR